jgi:hypothetical protein
MAIIEFRFHVILRAFSAYNAAAGTGRLKQLPAMFEWPAAGSGWGSKPQDGRMSW